MKPFYTAAEVADREGISERRVRILCEEGRILFAQKVGVIWTISLKYIIKRKAHGRPRKYQSASKTK